MIIVKDSFSLMPDIWSCVDKSLMNDWCVKLIIEPQTITRFIG